MKRRYCIEIADGPSPYYHFAYFDTDEYLADCLFAHEKVDVTVEGEYGNEEDPYRIILCRIPRQHRKGFLHAIDLLPGLMAYAGKTGYDDYCMDVLATAAQYAEKREDRGSPTPLQ